MSSSSSIGIKDPGTSGPLSALLPAEHQPKPVLTPIKKIRRVLIDNLTLIDTTSDSDTLFVEGGFNPSIVMLCIECMTYRRQSHFLCLSSSESTYSARCKRCLRIVLTPNASPIPKLRRQLT
jgi:hypothetical protein